MFSTAGGNDIGAAIGAGREGAKERRRLRKDIASLAWMLQVAASCWRFRINKHQRSSKGKLKIVDFYVPSFHAKLFLASSTWYREDQPEFEDASAVFLFTMVIMT